jgi:hypothetical protein
MTSGVSFLALLAKIGDCFESITKVRRFYCRVVIHSFWS